MTLKGLMGAKY